MAIERGAPPAPAPAPGPRVLTLQHGEHHDSTLYRLEKGTRLQFRPGASLLGRKVFLYTNYVVADTKKVSGDEAEFVRNQYYGLEWRRVWGEGAGEGESLGGGLLVDDTDVCAEVELTRAGTYHYYFEYDAKEGGVGPQGSGWVQVSPTLVAGGRQIPLDAVTCQTVLAKCLGPMTRWERVLRVASETGYNMIHFTPVQELGASGSSYSIANQLRLDPRYGASLHTQPTFADVENIVTKMRDEWHVLSICDVVLNHTANETPWLREHPEAAYNLRDCPYLRPAALLDAVLARLTADVARGALADAGLPPARCHAPRHVDALRPELERRVAAARLHECYQCDADDVLRQFLALARNRVPSAGGDSGGGAALKLVSDPQRRRLKATVDLELALQIYNVHRAERGEEARLAACGAELRRALDALNAQAAADTQAHLAAAVDNCLAGIRYFRLEADGPKIEEVSAENPLVPRYFTLPADVCAAGVTLAGVEEALWGEAGAGVHAHNGWVMDADPLQDFAARDADGRVYLRRELIAWGDSVKLRYGSCPADSPFLWAQMREYVEMTAEVFAGLRLDNCHSTPLHVAEYMVDCARSVRPDLYVVAELFTNSDHVDNIFVNRLGITALVREALSAWDAREQGRLVHRFGGRPVGAFLPPGGARPQPAAPQVARAMLLDLTHDNPSPVHKRSVFDMLPSAALVAMACCATGSTRGYDELVPHHVHVVDEERVYREWAEGEDEGGVCARTGILGAKRELNRLHVELAAHGYSEVFVDQMDEHVVAVTRHSPATRHSVVMVAATAFRPPAPGDPPRPPPPPLRFEGNLLDDAVAMEATLRHHRHRSGEWAWTAPGDHTPHPTYITGLDQYECELRTQLPLAQSAVFAAHRRDGTHTELQFRALPPGTVAVVRVAPRPPAAAALLALHRALAPVDDPLQLAAALAPLDLADFNVLLYRCDAEEREAGPGGVYDVPGHGPLVYAGLQGAASLLDTVRPAHDLGHALCANLRAGDWLADYTWRRLRHDPRLHPVADRWRAALAPLRDLPRYLQPAYFDAVLRELLRATRRAALARMAAWCRGGGLARALALTSVQLAGCVPSAPLPTPPEPGPARALSLSAGLPHFAVGYMRCWGRDTFIALRGLFLLTGRHVDARNHILGFAACLRHGLIPNLLDGGARARYNCRDAVWWWLESIQQYVREAPGGAELLGEPVARLFPRDDSEAGEGGVVQPLHRVMQEALEAHFEGRAFRERGAGRQLDAHMTDRGFNVQLGVHPDTGFPFGGNDANCGTWMDKMGSSERAGNRGRPATPRDGSAVELVALCHSAVSWLAGEHRAGRYPHAGVTRRAAAGPLAWTWPQWAERIERAFERRFWVPEAPSAADARPDLVHRRAIYKDSHGASQPWADYQLRCNFPVAMAVAPALFDPRHAWLALDTLERHLLGPLGVKTLDPADWAYRPDYRNSDDSHDPSVAHGFNYHQGPEWLWPLGFYLRARLAFAHAVGLHARTVAAVLRALGPLADEVRASPWRGLPELTNAAGAQCPDSCRTQAWSSAAVLEVLHDLRHTRRATALRD